MYKGNAAAKRKSLFAVRPFQIGIIRVPDADKVQRCALHRI